MLSDEGAGLIIDADSSRLKHMHMFSGLRR
jgi:hypothetical protein